MNKILCLNSGGFDSVVMLHHLKELYPDAEIDTLFFRWGQHSCKIEEECAMKSSLKVLNKPPIIMTVPSAEIWGSVSMTKDDQYIPMRNFVFISMATAYAQKNGYDTIALSLIDNEVEEVYFDCSKEFIHNLNVTLESQGIQIITPFLHRTKWGLYSLARAYDINLHDFFSCNTPVDGKACGECNDCKAIDEIYEYWVDPLRYVSPEDPNYLGRYLKNEIFEMRLLINNKCQFKCKHCFYGFDDTIDPDLSIDEFKDAIRQAKDLGITHIHISGKEPLVNSDIFELTEYMDELNMTYDIVTNGVNIKKYLDLLVDCKGLNCVLLSVDSLDRTTLRNTGKHLANNIHALIEGNIKYEIDMDLYKGNLDTFEETLLALKEIGVTNTVYVRAVLPLGNAKSNDLDLITCEDWKPIIEKAIEGEYALPIKVSLNKKYYWDSTYDDIREYIDWVEVTNNSYISQTLELWVEKYCVSHLNQVTLTSDGYLLGCGTQVSYPKYWEISPGSIRNTSLRDLIVKGKLEHVHKYSNLSQNTCYFNVLPL